MTRGAGTSRSPPPDGPRTTAWRALARDVEACRRCPLGAIRNRAVVYRGGARPLVVFVGEAPGAEEDRVGRPFVGRSGGRLDAATAAALLAPDEVGILNLIKCRPPGNRFPPASQRACRPFLDRQVALLAPRLLVPLGARALAVLDPSAPSITRCAGARRDGGGIPLFPMLHPAAPLHNPNLRTRWARDVARLRAVVSAVRA